MNSAFEKKAKDLVQDLQGEIRRLETELGAKQEALQKLQALFGLTTVVPKRRGRKPATATVIDQPVRRGRRPKIAGRRKSKNRDIVLEAAKGLTGRFKLHELQGRVLQIDPTFGGNHVSGTIISVLKTTPEIKKVRRGEYKLGK